MSIARRAIIKKPLFLADSEGGKLHEQERKPIARIRNSGVLSSAQPLDHASQPAPGAALAHNRAPHSMPCPPCPDELKFGAFRDFHQQAERARMNMQAPQELALLPFHQAAEIWLELHRDAISHRTYTDYRFYIRTLNKTFGPQAPGEKGMLLSQIHIGHIMAYRRERQKTAGAWCINHEMTTLKQIMELGGLWDLIAKHYKPLKIEQTGPPRVLSADEEEKFFRVVSQKEGWQVAYWATSLTSNTTAFGCELRFLQLKHLHLDKNPPQIHIPDDKVKNEFRARVIPLNATALEQVNRLLERARKLGAHLPEHYLFPFRVKKGSYDVTRPASAFFIRSAFRSMKKALGPEFAWLQPRHFRNQCFTKLFESGAPDETIISIGGHAAIKMSRYYSRIRIQAKFDALEKIAPKSASSSNREKGGAA